MSTITDPELQVRKRPESGDSQEREFRGGPLPAVLSAIIPGLGQIVAGAVRRGLLIAAGIGTLLALYLWRLAELGVRAGDGWPAIVRAFERRPGFAWVVLLAILASWVLNVLDALRLGDSEHRSPPGLFLGMGLAFLILGWQITDIDLGQAVRGFPEASRLIGEVAWPWAAAIDYEDLTVRDRAAIHVGAETPPPVSDPPGQGAEFTSGGTTPALRVSPNYGELSRQGRLGEVADGSSISLRGTGFEPGIPVAIWWIDEIGSEFRIRREGNFVTFPVDENGAFLADIRLPFPLAGAQTGDEEPIVHYVEARQVFQGEAFASEALIVSLSLMAETIIMGMMATFFGIIFSVPVSFLAARNIMSGSRATMVVYYITRTLLNIIRSIEPLIWALIGVVWVGLGPFAGLIALTIHSIAALGKLYSEAIEGIDPGPIEAIQATGANRMQTIFYAVIPQMISPFISFSIYRWDINVRMSTIIGVVGGGGIGFILQQYIRLLDYRSAGIAVWFIALTVALLDYVSSEIRQRLA